MKMTVRFAALWSLLFVLTNVVRADEVVRLATDPALSPDGSLLAFAWRGDIWTVPATGGVAKPLTQHSGVDRQPIFSPDGANIAFVGDRGQGRQVYVVPVTGGAPKQLTFHSEGYTLEDWYPDGKSLLVSATRDNFWRDAERFFKLRCDTRAAEELLFDDYGSDGSLSADGKKLLFTREGPAWWRKGYHGSQSAQIWLCDGDAKSFSKLLAHEKGCKWPLWKPDGSGFYFVGCESGSGNLWEYDFSTKSQRQLTRMEDDSVAFPCLSRDGSLIVFRHLYDLYRFRPGSSEEPKKIDIRNVGDLITDPVQRITLQQATQVAFSNDGLDIAFIAGGDLWVMDTELREPKQVTKTPEEERNPVFAPDGQSIVFVSDCEDQCDIWRAKRSDTKKFWWLNESFALDRLTKDSDIEADLKWSPDGTRIAFIKGSGDLWTMAVDGTDARRIVKSFDEPQYDWSPDGKWFVYSKSDHDFNRDIWVLPSDGTGTPFNISRHPDNDVNPAWSPDGKVIAFTGRRIGTETDIYYVWLQAADDETNSRDRTLKKAIDKASKSKSKSTKSASDSSTTPSTPSATATTATDASSGTSSSRPLPKVVIDFEKLHERIHRISIPDSAETGLFWSPDGKRLAFTADIRGQRGVYTVDLPDSLSPRIISSQIGSQPRWLSEGNQIVWLVDGVPTSFTPGSTPVATTTSPTTSSRFGTSRSTPEPTTSAPTGGGTAYRFSVRQIVDRAARYRAAFDLCWRTMRDNYYDERLGNRNWDAIRRKYSDAAAAAPDDTTLATVVNMMLGELNGSHLGFLLSGPRSTSAAGIETPVGGTWRDVTAHLGVRFDPVYKGPGLKVRDILPDGPADQKRSKIAAGELILSIDGTSVDPAMDLTSVLNGPLARDIRLRVRNSDGNDRDVIVRPISYFATSELLYEKWIDDNRKMVSEASGGKLAYLHIRGMNDPSFHRFEEELYSAASGADGLVIDVRENGGGSTTDHLLTVLTQPVHAITVPRGGTPGYPQDRKIYATWNKPIVVMCNQNSFSNAEIFSHAIKTLKRGQLVGVPTAGGVISTGAANIMGMGTLRLPGRGWYVLDTGEDMELNGAVPQHVLWPEPGQLPQGKDIQLAKAIEVLQADVKAWLARPQPKLRKATER